MADNARLLAKGADCALDSLWCGAKLRDGCGGGLIVESEGEEATHERRRTKALLWLDDAGAAGKENLGLAGPRRLCFPCAFGISEGGLSIGKGLFTRRRHAHCLRIGLVESSE